jgi:hypothetical protein
VRLIGGRQMIVWEFKDPFDCCLINVIAGQFCSWTRLDFEQVQTKALNVEDADEVDNGYDGIDRDCCKSTPCINVCFVGILGDDVELYIKRNKKPWEFFLNMLCDFLYR